MLIDLQDKLAAHQLQWCVYLITEKGECKIKAVLALHKALCQAPSKPI